MSGADGLRDWIVERGLEADNLTALVGETAERLVALGLPLWRMHVSFPTINPEIRGRNHVWVRGEGAVLENVGHERFEGAFEQSPFRVMLEEGVLLRRWRFEEIDGPTPYPVLERVRENGATEYLARITSFGGSVAALPGTAISFATDRPGGFVEADVALVGAVVPTLALAACRIALLDVTVDVLGAYVGHDAGRRVLGGEMRRGRGHTLAAALVFADLRGFTGVAESGGEGLIARLGEHLAAMAEPIEAKGGEVLKFLGDGLLAAFAVEDGVGAGQACAAALRSARDAIARNARVNEARAGEPRLDLDVALHLGAVFYGNVGAGGRLDFTVIGPAVNEASRLEALCGQLGRPLLMSAPFAAVCGARVVSLGRHVLRGVAEPREVFGLSCEAAPALPHGGPATGGPHG